MKSAVLLVIATGTKAEKPGLYQMPYNTTIDPRQTRFLVTPIFREP
ncbi:hypothetical protein [Dapis sp. BLCC M172]